MSKAEKKLSDESGSVEINGKVIRRSDFGKSEFGEAIYQLVIHGAPCEAIIGGKKCNKLAIGSIDYDVIGDHTFNLICSQDHFDRIKEIVERDLSITGRITAFGINGRGRQ